MRQLLISIMLQFQCVRGEFTCHDGHCVEMSKRCNKLIDCQDESDEKNCNLLKNNGATANKIYPPIHKRKLNITVSFELLSIYQVDELNMKLNCKFQLTMMWNDERITFNNLMEGGNLLNSTDVEGIWIPTLTFVNSNDLGENSLNTKSGQNQEVLAAKESQGLSQDTSKINDKLMYPGSQNSLTLLATYIKEVQCDFHLQLYPFDSQTCRIILTVPKKYEKHIKLVTGSVDVDQDMRISQFELQNVSLVTYKQHKSIECVFTLKRNVAVYHIYSTFLPTTLILIMSLASLYINEDHFEATIMVSLTCMLVLYTLLQSIMTGMPVTQYVNLMAIWLAFNLAIPFLVFMTIISWEFMKRRIGFQGNAKKDVCKVVMQCLLPSISILFVMGYSCVAIYFHFML